MTAEAIDRLVEAVLYEGYILYPYRASSTKNRYRFTTGRVYPRAYHDACRGAEPCEMQTQVLLESLPGAASPTVSVEVRFLQPVAREIGRLAEPLAALPDGREPAFEIVPSLEVDGTPYEAWQEAVERRVPLPAHPADALADAPFEQPIAFAAGRTLEPIRDAAGRVAGVIVRRHPALAGCVRLSAERIDDRLVRLTVRITNETPAAPDDPDELLLHTFASTHTLLHAGAGGFVSLMDPPPRAASAAADCANVGTWPVLVGDGAGGDRSWMLSSPIILYDYPELAPESPGDLFDGTEIDELLTLRIQTLTVAEKQAMYRTDERARSLLERTEALPRAVLERLHGAVRMMRPADDPFAAAPGPGAPSRIDVGGASLGVGDRVRIRPRHRADVMDIALEGRTAVIESIEQDFEDRLYLALVLDDDPGRDLGHLRFPGHRFFYAPDEVEPMAEGS